MSLFTISHWLYIADVDYSCDYMFDLRDNSLGMYQFIIYTTIAALSPKSVFTNLSSQFDRLLPARSQFDTNHRVNLSTPKSCQSATFVRPLFAFVLCFLRHKIIKKTKCDESVSIGVIDQVRIANCDPNSLLQIKR